MRCYEMIYFSNNRTVRFDDLRQAVNEDGKSVYDENLLQKIESGDFNCLNNIDLEYRNNKYYMEPLLYAVKNSEYSTYEIYKYYGESLQKSDMNIATEIVIEEPEVIEDTAISKEENIILHLIKYNPEVILYISNELKSDGEFIEEICKTGNKEAIMYAVKECNISTVLQDNPELASNPVFMKEAIREDANALKYADENLKNDYKFIREVSKSNREVINYVVEHTKEFGKEAIEGAKDSLEEKLLTETKKEVEVGRAKLETEKDKLTPEQINRKERDLNSISRMIKRFEEAETPEKKGRYAHVILVTTGMEQYQNMDEDFREELVKYEKLYIAFKEKSKSKEIQKDNKEITDVENRDNFIITPAQIEEKTEETRTSEINKETYEIREEYVRQTEEKEVEENDRGTIEEK